MKQQDNTSDLISFSSPKLQTNLKISLQEKRKKIANESSKNLQNMFGYEFKDHVNLSKKNSDLLIVKKENQTKNLTVSSSNLYKDLAKQINQQSQQSNNQAQSNGKFTSFNQVKQQADKQKAGINLEIKNPSKIEQDQNSHRTKRLEDDKKKPPQSAPLQKKEDFNQSTKVEAKRNTPDRSVQQEILSILEANSRNAKNQEISDNNPLVNFGKSTKGAFYQPLQYLDQDETQSSIQKKMAQSSSGFSQSNGFEFQGKRGNKMAIVKKLYESTQHSSSESRFHQRPAFGSAASQGTSFQVNNSNSSFKNLDTEYFKKLSKKQSIPFTENSPKQSKGFNSFYESQQTLKEKNEIEKESNEEYQIERQEINADMKNMQSSKQNSKTGYDEGKQMSSAPYKLSKNETHNISKIINGQIISLHGKLGHDSHIITATTPYEQKKIENIVTLINRKESQKSPYKKVKSKKEFNSISNISKIENTDKKLINTSPQSQDSFIKNDKFTSTGTNFRKQNSNIKDTPALKASPSAQNLVKSKSNRNNQLDQNNQFKSNDSLHQHATGQQKLKKGMMNTMFAQKIISSRVSSQPFKLNGEQTTSQEALTLKGSQQNLAMSPQEAKLINLSLQSVALSPSAQPHKSNLQDIPIPKPSKLSDYITQVKPTQAFCSPQQSQQQQQQQQSQQQQQQQTIVIQKQPNLNLEMNKTIQKSNNQFLSQEELGKSQPDSPLRLSELISPPFQEKRKERANTPINGGYCYYNTWMVFHNRYPNEADQMCLSFSDHFIQTFNSLRYCKTLQPIDPIQLQMKQIDLPPIPRKEKTIIFDLDETLVHYNEDSSLKSDVIISVDLPNGEHVEAGINIRPYARECLKELYKYYEIIILTASHSSYADKVIDYLDPENKYVDFRFNRDSCIVSNEGVHIKDLRIFKNRDLSKMVIVDNAAYSFCLQLENGIPIIPFYDNYRDMELKFLVDFVKLLLPIEDVRNYLSKTFKFHLYAESESVEEALQKVYNILPSQNPLSREEFSPSNQEEKQEAENPPFQQNRLSMNQEQIEIGEEDDDDLDLERYHSFEEHNEEDTQETQEV